MFSSSRQNRVADILNKVKFTYTSTRSLYVYTLRIITLKGYFEYTYTILYVYTCLLNTKVLFIQRFSVNVILLLDAWR